MESTEAKIVEEKIIKSINNKEEITKENLRMAGEIGFKNVPDQVITTDQYGFIIQDDKK
jgi:hypothetical protein